MYILYSLYSHQQLCYHQTTHQQLSKYLPVVVCDRMQLRNLVQGHQQLVPGSYVGVE
jgi:hypothetical protein